MTKIFKTKNLPGVYCVLALLPIWETAAILFVMTQLAILVGRDIFEGLPYQVAYSAAVGDAGFVVSVLIAATILQRCQYVAVWWPRTGKAQTLVLYASVVIGTVASMLTISSRSGRTMDIYHDVVVVPLFLYLAITLLPVIFKNGKRVEIVATLCCILLWAILVVFDVMHDRMNQREWLGNHVNVIEQMRR